MLEQRQPTMKSREGHPREDEDPPTLHAQVTLLMVVYATLHIGNTSLMPTFNGPDTFGTVRAESHALALWPACLVHTPQPSSLNYSRGDTAEADAEYYSLTLEPVTTF